MKYACKEDRVWSFNLTENLIVLYLTNYLLLITPWSTLIAWWTLTYWRPICWRWRDTWATTSTRLSFVTSWRCMRQLCHCWRPASCMTRPPDRTSSLTRTSSCLPWLWWPSDSKVCIYCHDGSSLKFLRNRICFYIYHVTKDNNLRSSINSNLFSFFSRKSISIYGLKVIACE